MFLKPFLICVIICYIFIPILFYKKYENYQDMYNTDFIMEVTSLKDYSENNITNIDSPKINKAIYNITNGLYSITDIKNINLLRCGSYSIILSIWFPYDTDIAYSLKDSTYYKNDKQIEKMFRRILYLTYAIKLNVTTSYLKYKKLIDEDKNKLIHINSEYNYINKIFYTKFINDYYSSEICKERNSKIESHVRNYRYTDMINKFKKSSECINTLYLLYQYI
jgi:hypothetical protein